MATKQKKKRVEQWSPVRRATQSERMRRNVNNHWDDINANPQKKNQILRERSVGFLRGHPLSIWRCDLRVNLTDKELAEILETSEMTVSNWQSGRAKPQNGNLQRLVEYANEIGVPIDTEWAQ